MSQQLARIRNLISEIDEIQKQGQAKARTFSHETPESVPPVTTESVLPIPGVVSIPDAAVVPSPPQEPGRIALSLSQNVILEVRVGSTAEAQGEVVEIKKAAQGLEIVFQDGKAFHIPFKDVA